MDLEALQIKAQQKRAELDRIEEEKAIAAEKELLALQGRVADLGPAILETIQAAQIILDNGLKLFEKERGWNIEKDPFLSDGFYHHFGFTNTNATSVGWFNGGACGPWDIKWDGIDEPYAYYDKRNWHGRGEAPAPRPLNKTECEKFLKCWPEFLENFNKKVEELIGG